MSDEHHDQSHTHASVIIIELPTGETGMMGRIVINCEQCGECSFMIPPHHWRVLRDIFVSWVDAYPEESKVANLQKASPPPNPLLN